MAKSLIITEKPSVARDIASALGGFTETDSHFESDRYLLTWAVGHLFELLEPEEVDEVYKRWTLDTLPIIPEKFQFKPKARQSERIRTIKKLLADPEVEDVVNACDAGREGELIFREILEYFGSDKPVRRLWLQSMTTSAIRQGFESLRPGEELEGLAAAAECRAFTDWLIGMNATRALTKRLRGRRERGAWSAGRVQTPTLALLVDRELEVLAHVPRPYWRIAATFEHEGQAYPGTWFDPEFREGADEDAREDRIFDEARARAVADAVRGQAGEASETRKPSRETAPPLFDLTSLQREANRRLGWSARRTLSAAQRCYEAHKLLTYPRTDSRCLPEDYRETVQNVLQSFADAGRGVVRDKDGMISPIGDYGAAARRLLEGGLENERRAFDDSKVSDHFAIIPTGQIPGDGLSGDDKRLYDLVTRRFLSTFHPAAVWERVERTTKVGEHHFRSRARTLVELGWRSIGGATGEEESSLPALVPGQSEASGVGVANTGSELEAEQTRPPPRITEARLLSLMENAGKQVEDEDLAAALHERGLGTPATRAEVIENLIAKGYVVRLGKALRPTAKGIRLIDILKRVHIDRLASAELTGEIEYHLNQVEQGGRTAADFMREMEGYAREIVETTRTFEYSEIYADDPPLGPCPSCARPVVEAPWFYRCEEKPEREEDCPLRIWKDTSGRYIDRATATALVNDGKTGTLEGFTARNGRTYQGMLEIDREEWAVRVRPVAWDDGSVSADPEYDVNTEPLGTCPFEEECQIVESATHFVCERKLKEQELGKDPERPKSCGFNFPRTVCKREITREEALYYLANGRTELLTDFTSRFGRPFSATLVLKKNGRHGFEFPPRAPRKGKDGGAEDEAGAQAGGRKKTSGKKTAGKKASGKKTTRKKTTRKKASGKKATRKKATRKKTSSKKTALKPTRSVKKVTSEPPAARRRGPIPSALRRTPSSSGLKSSPKGPNSFFVVFLPPSGV
ncbi:MAG: DNA topoisomerase 3 [Myxococcota bacterium]|nr:DNA topoisomerase 3 [Myxococcota bacterium]